jgi:hypothetical protein
MRDLWTWDEVDIATWQEQDYKASLALEELFHLDRQVERSVDRVNSEATRCHWIMQILKTIRRHKTIEKPQSFPKYKQEKSPTYQLKRKSTLSIIVEELQPSNIETGTFTP